jgi:NADPH:quinone reductase-like Zn-dependent oxidoreductase
MRAVVYRSVGTPEVIEVAEIDLPEPGMFEIRIKVDAAALNPADVAAWSGIFPAPPDGSHFGLGWDVAGTVDAVGPGAAWELGTPVIAIVQGATGVVRAQAEHAIVPSNAIAIAPAGVDAIHAATIPLNGLTAAQSVELLGLSAGQSVFITGAGGAVGGYAVQLAKRRGLRVIASDLPDDEEYVTTVLGADSFLQARTRPPRCASSTQTAWTPYWTLRRWAAASSARSPMAGSSSPPGQMHCPIQNAAFGCA